MQTDKDYDRLEENVIKNRELLEIIIGNLGIIIEETDDIIR